MLVTSAFVKFYVQAPSPTTVSRNAVDVLMAAAHARSSKVLPEKIEKCKDEPFNSIVEWLKEENLTWKSSEVDSGTATNTVSTLQCVLWYIDGHHKNLADRSCSVPSIFSKFTGYNLPERSKHRRRSIQSFSREILRSHSQRLFGNLQNQFWLRNGWITFRREVELLAQLLSKYADLLDVKRAKITACHDSDVPVRSICDALSVLFIKPRHSKPPELVQISLAIAEVEVNVPVDLEDFLPSDRHRRYDCIQLLKCGLSAMLATYSPGSNVGSLHWLWRTDATDISSAINTC